MNKKITIKVNPCCVYLIWIWSEYHAFVICHVWNNKEHVLFKKEDQTNYVQCVYLLTMVIGPSVETLVA